MKLPKESSIDVTKWQCHNLRVSKLTQLKNEGRSYEYLMKISGHRSLDSLMRYMKTDEEEVLRDQHARNKMVE